MGPAGATSLLALSVDKNLAGKLSPISHVKSLLIIFTLLCAPPIGGNFVFYFVSVIALLGFAAGGLIIEGPLDGPGVRYD